MQLNLKSAGGPSKRRFLGFGAGQVVHQTRTGRQWIRETWLQRICLHQTLFSDDLIVSVLLLGT